MNCEILNKKTFSRGCASFLSFCTSKKNSDTILCSKNDIGMTLLSVKAFIYYVRIFLIMCLFMQNESKRDLMSRTICPNDNKNVGSLFCRVLQTPCFSSYET